MRASLLFLFLTVQAGPVAALINCKTADLATRLLTVQLDLMGQTDRPGPLLDTLSRHLSDWSGTVGIVRSVSTTEADIQTILALVHISRSLIWSDGTPDQLAAILTAAETLSVRDRATLAVLRTGCNTGTGARPASTDLLMNLPNDQTATPASRRFGVIAAIADVTPRVATGTLAVAAVTLVAGVWIIKTNAQRRRRRRRYKVVLDVTFKGSTGVCDGRLLDLNCYGFKLHHFGALSQNPRIDIRIQGKWRGARIVWQNAHYAGGTFAKPMSLPEVLLIAGKSGQRRLASGKYRTT